MLDIWDNLSQPTEPTPRVSRQVDYGVRVTMLYCVNVGSVPVKNVPFGRMTMITGEGIHVCWERV